MLDTLTLQYFISRSGARFGVEGTEGLTLSLHQAKSVGSPSGAAPGARMPFELIFLGPKSPVLPQRIYRLEREGDEPLEVFIVPIGPIEDGIGYQAIFN